MRGISFAFILVFSGLSFVQAHESIIEVYFSAENHRCFSTKDFDFCGSNQNYDALNKWLEQVVKTPIGQSTFSEIQNSNHRLLIMHHETSVNSGGITLSQATSALFDGRGVDAVIQMNFNMPDSGSHLVSALQTSNLIPFTASQNLFHELVHAKHSMNGTLAAMREVQAIEEENLFRQQEAQNSPQRDYRSIEDDQQIWFSRAQ